MIETNEEMREYKQCIERDAEKTLKLLIPRQIFHIQEQLNSPSFDKKSFEKKLEEHCFEYIFRDKQNRCHLDREEHEDEIFSLTNCAGDCLRPPTKSKTLKSRCENVQQSHYKTEKTTICLPNKKSKFLMFYLPIAMFEELKNTVVAQSQLALHNLRSLANWIRLRVPRIEDGNNFGVETQEKIISSIERIETANKECVLSVELHLETFRLLSQSLCKVHPIISHSQTPVLSEILPISADYRAAIRSELRFAFLNLRFCLHKLLNCLCSTQDLVEKNLDRIKNPRSDNSSNLY